MTSNLKLPDEEATLRLGRALAGGDEGVALRGLVLHLRGDLGAGKTTLVRGLLRALGHAGRVKSPTYTLVEPYRLSKLYLYHFDFYRFKDQAEWLNSGFREHFNADSLCVVEWPERAELLLPPPDLQVALAYREEARAASLSSHGAHGDAWCARALARWRSS